MIARLSALRQKPEMAFARTDLSRLVADTIDGLEELRGVPLTADLAPLPEVSVDAEQVRGVVANLLLNARDAIGAGGGIRVSTSQAPGRAVLTIADDGCGMSAAFVRDSLFRPFKTTKRNGLGIGMFQSKQIVEAHGGTIAVETDPGKGTTVRVSFPARRDS